jgi:hypothetical protein
VWPILRTTHYSNNKKPQHGLCYVCDNEGHFAQFFWYWNMKAKGKGNLSFKNKSMNNVNDHRRDSTIDYEGLYMYIQLQRFLKCL